MTHLRPVSHPTETDLKFPAIPNRSNSMKKFALGLLIPLAALAQDIRVSGNSTATDVLRSTNTSTASSNRVGVHGLSTPVAGFGIGVQGTGGNYGVYGRAAMARV